MWRLAKGFYFVLALLITLLIIAKSLDYFVPVFNRGFLLDKQSIFPYYKFFLYAHIIGAPIALLTGIFQFSFTRSQYHPVIGKIYLLSILFLAAPGALLMSFYAIGGIPSIVNFLLMTGLWCYFSLKAYSHIRQGEVERHQSMMIRSFILTNSAVWIRLLSFLNHQFHFIELELGYVLISWLSWLPALLCFEVMEIRRRKVAR